MLYHCDVKTIFMLCNLVEYGWSACSQYWPSVKEEMKVEGILVENLETVELNDSVVVRKLRLTDHTGEPKDLT